MPEPKKDQKDPKKAAATQAAEAEKSEAERKAKAEAEAAQAAAEAAQKAAEEAKAKAVAARVAAAQERNKVLCEVPRAYRFTMPDHTVRHVAAGTQELDPEIANHWWSKAHGVKVLGSLKEGS